MLAMLYEGGGTGIVREGTLPIPFPGPGQVRIRVRVCAVCRTDLHVVDGDLPDPKLPLVPGHEIVGIVDDIGPDVADFAGGERVGIPWLGFTCGQCELCRNGRENLCPAARFTGYQIDGGFAEYAIVNARFAFRLPDTYDDLHVAPLLCAGLIGHRTYRMAGNAHAIGIYGFGAAAHIVTQVAAWEGREVFAFTRPGDLEAQRFARTLGAVWAGASGDSPPKALDAAMIFAPVGDLVPEALQHIKPGGVVVCGGIHMSDIPTFPYRLLWGERIVRSVANLTRQDAREFLDLAPHVPVRTEIRQYDLRNANRALADLRQGAVQGAAVLTL